MLSSTVHPASATVQSSILPVPCLSLNRSLPPCYPLPCYLKSPFFATPFCRLLPAALPAHGLYPVCLDLSRLGTAKNPSCIHFSFQSLARCPSRNSFLLITIHFHGGCTPSLSRLSSLLRAPRRSLLQERNLTPLSRTTSALFLKRRGCMGSLPVLKLAARPLHPRFPAFQLPRPPRPAREPARRLGRDPLGEQQFVPLALCYDRFTLSLEGSAATRDSFPASWRLPLVFAFRFFPIAIQSMKGGRPLRAPFARSTNPGAIHGAQRS